MVDSVEKGHTVLLGLLNHCHATLVITVLAVTWPNQQDCVMLDIIVGREQQDQIQWTESLVSKSVLHLIWEIYYYQHLVQEMY
jgi:hypothetical protein